MRWTRVTRALLLSAAASGLCIPAQAAPERAGWLSSVCYHALPAEARVAVVALDDDPVDVAVGKRIEDVLMGSSHADASKPASATLTFQTAVRREWHDGTGFKSDESLTGPTDMPDPDDRRLWHRERGSVDVAPRVRLFPLERATSPPDTHSVVPVYVLTVAVDETRTGRRLWQGKVSYRGAIANDDATAFDALLPRLVQNIGHTVRAEGFELN